MRIAGTNIPDNKRLPWALSYIYGIGVPLGFRLAAICKIDPMKKAGELTNVEITRLRDVIETKYRTEDELRRQTRGNIKRLIDLGTWRGTRHARHLPVRGGRTKTNSRTVRGNVRRTVTSGKHKVELK